MNILITQTCLKVHYRQVNLITAFAHDSVFWALFTARLNRTHPGLFVDVNGKFTLSNLYGDASIHPDTATRDKADLTRVGWPGKFK